MKKKIFHEGLSVLFPAFFLLAVGSLWPVPSTWSAQEVKEGRGTVKMSVVIVNPSKKKTQKVPVKVYLPSEVTPEDILYAGGLKVEFDTQSSTYYLYGDDVELKPKETQSFELKLRDAWYIPKEQLNTLRAQTKAMISHLKGTDDYESAQKMGEAINKALDVIGRTQSDATLSTKRHIGVYRNNQKIIAQIKEDVDRLEKQAKLAKKAPASKLSQPAAEKPAAKPAATELVPTPASEPSPAPAPAPKSFFQKISQFFQGVMPSK